MEDSWESQNVIDIWLEQVHWQSKVDLARIFSEQIIL